MLAREIHHLGYLGLGDLVGVDAALSDPMLMHMQHDLGRFLPSLLKEPLQHMHDEFHRRVVVIEDQHAIETRPLRLWPGLGDNVRCSYPVRLWVLSRRNPADKPRAPSTIKLPLARVLISFDPAAGREQGTQDM